MAPLIYLDTHVAAWLFSDRVDLLPAGVRIRLEESDLLIQLKPVPQMGEPSASVDESIDQCHYDRQQTSPRKQHHGHSARQESGGRPARRPWRNGYGQRAARVAALGAVVVLSTRQALLTPVPTRAELPAVRFSPTYQRLASALVGSSVSVSLYGALSKPRLVYTSDVDAVDWIAGGA